MNEYNATMIARAEHEHMVRSLPTVSEFGANVRDAEPGWMSKQVAHLLHMVGSGLAALSKRLVLNRNRQGFKAPENELKPGEWQRLSQ
ncbi:MAG: hypothetical protein ACYDBJ_02590 [Aggregatilineales bacterium]